MKSYIKLEPDEYYFNSEGKMVLTEKYLIKQGKCCNNKCKHCPYNKNDRK